MKRILEQDRKLEATPRTEEKRRSQRGRYGKAAVHAVLDEVFLFHVSFVVEGRRVAIPTALERDGEKLYLHGAPLICMLTTQAVQKQPPWRGRQDGRRQG